MATPRTLHADRRRPRIPWVAVGRFVLRAARWLFLLFLGFMVVALSLSRNPSERLMGLFVLALTGVSLAYLLFVSSRLTLDFPGINERDVEAGEGVETDGPEDDHVNAKSPHGLPRHKGPQGLRGTIQVVRLDAGAARVTVANNAPLPVLYARTALSIVQEDPEDAGSGKPAASLVLGEPFVVPAHASLPTSVSNVFGHVGIYTLDAAGVRMRDLTGLFSRTCGMRGLWRVRVVPNLYRLTQGIPRRRSVTQTSIGLPDTPSDTLDYDRVRDYRPGDPLKTIHWKLVAHGQGDLYTKLFETATVSSVTLLVDPTGPEGSDTYEVARSQFDTMLEGGLSLMEHAREAGLRGSLRFVDRGGSLIETRWEGWATLGWFVEMVRRPSSAPDAASRGVAAIHSIRDDKSGYVIVATSCLTTESVRELIACHRFGVSLLVVHALPRSAGSDRQRQEFFDAQLRNASVDVIALTEGSQIIREVAS